MYALKNALLRIGMYSYALTRSQIEKLHAPHSQFGILSARRHEYSNKENKDRKGDLIRYVQDLNLRWETTQGVWPEKGELGFGVEDSILVWDVPFDFLLDLGRLYEQESIIFKPQNGPVGMYDLQNNVAFIWDDYDITPNVKKPRMVEDGEKLPNSTNIRDTQVTYGFNFDMPIPFSSTPIVRVPDEQMQSLG